MSREYDPLFKWCFNTNPTIEIECHQSVVHGVWDHQLFHDASLLLHARNLEASGVKGWVANGGDSSLDGSHSPCPTCGCVLGHVEAWYCEQIGLFFFFRGGSLHICRKMLIR